MTIRILSIFIFICACRQATAQQYTLLDRRFDKAAKEVDTVTRQNLSEGWFPVLTSELDSLISLADRLKNLRDDGLKRKFYYSEDFKTPSLRFQIENIKRAYGDGYEINLTSSGYFGEPTIKLADPRENLLVNQRTIREFISYLKRVAKSMR